MQREHPRKGGMFASSPGKCMYTWMLSCCFPQHIAPMLVDLSSTPVRSVCPHLHMHANNCVLACCPDTLSGTMSQYQEMEQTVYNSLFTLIKDTSVLRDYAAAAILIIQVTTSCRRKLQEGTMSHPPVSKAHRSFCFSHCGPVQLLETESQTVICPGSDKLHRLCEPVAALRPPWTG